jgi:transcription elongation factor GreA
MIELTQAEMNTLQAELADLRGPKRAEAVEAIAHARGFGDLSENFEYHAAKDAQGLLEARIAALEEKLRSAVVISDKRDTGGVVVVGSTVTITADGDTSTVRISNSGGAGSVSPDSPLGSALLGRKKGDVAKVAAPAGRWQAQIVEVS